jgi:ATP-dependent HslUV protease, peptidase subunit HslV
MFILILTILTVEFFRPLCLSEKKNSTKLIMFSRTLSQVARRRRYYSMSLCSQENANQDHIWGGPNLRATTIVCVRKDSKVVMAGDGQVSRGSTVVKGNARKVRRIGEGMIAGFAGGAADALTLFERLEGKLEEYPGQLLRAAVELGKDWRRDKYLRQLGAVMLVADAHLSLLVSGTGDVLELGDVMGIGSGGDYALAAARGLADVDGFDAEAIVVKAMRIASELCVYTNNNLTVESIDVGDAPPPDQSLSNEPIHAVLTPTAAAASRVDESSSDASDSDDEPSPSQDADTLQ